VCLALYVNQYIQTSYSYMYLENKKIPPFIKHISARTERAMIDRDWDCAAYAYMLAVKLNER
jgi:hypothetical protein